MRGFERTSAKRESKGSTKVQTLAVGQNIRIMACMIEFMECFICSDHGYTNYNVQSKQIVEYND